MPTSPNNILNGSSSSSTKSGGVQSPRGRTTSRCRTRTSTAILVFICSTCLGLYLRLMLHMLNHLRDVGLFSMSQQKQQQQHLYFHNYNSSIAGGKGREEMNVINGGVLQASPILEEKEEKYAQDEAYARNMKEDASESDISWATGEVIHIVHTR